VNSTLNGFHPAVQRWFAGRFGAPSRVQELGWPVIGEAQQGAGHDVLLCAPTGSGKTLAAFMWAINRLVVQAERGAFPDEISVLYVSPLKAVANDIRINLDRVLPTLDKQQIERDFAQPARSTILTEVSAMLTSASQFAPPAPTASKIYKA
jgi:ATP-dependent Lhr-like helicase